MNSSTNKMILLVISLLMLIPVLMACAAPVVDAAEPEGKPVQSLENTQWVLIDLDGSVPLADAEVTIRFSEDRMGGSAGCNTYSASYEVEGSTLTSGPAISTMMACLGEVMDQEIAYLTHLQTVGSYAISGDQLTLTTDDGHTLAFRLAGDANT